MQAVPLMAVGTQRQHGHSPLLQCDIHAGAQPWTHSGFFQGCSPAHMLYWKQLLCLCSRCGPTDSNVTAYTEMYGIPVQACADKHGHLWGYGYVGPIHTQAICRSVSKAQWHSSLGIPLFSMGQFTAKQCVRCLLSHEASKITWACFWAESCVLAP